MVLRVYFLYWVSSLVQFDFLDQFKKIVIKLFQFIVYIKMDSAPVISYVREIKSKIELFVKVLLSDLGLREHNVTLPVLLPDYQLG